MFNSENVQNRHHKQPLRRRIPRLSATLRYRMLSGDSFESPIFFLQLWLAVALDRSPTCYRVPPLNHLSSSYTLNRHKDRCMSYVISMNGTVDPRQTVVSNLSEIIRCLVGPRFEYSTLVVRAKQHNHSAIAAVTILNNSARFISKQWHSNL
jgi:hypothetical protein